MAEEKSVQVKTVKSSIGSKALVKKPGLPDTHVRDWGMTCACAGKDRTAPVVNIQRQDKTR